MAKVMAMHSEIAEWSGLSAALVRLQHTVSSTVNAKAEISVVLSDPNLALHDARTTIALMSEIEPMNSELETMIHHAAAVVELRDAERTANWSGQSANSVAAKAQRVWIVPCCFDETSVQRLADCFRP